MEMVGCLVGWLFRWSCLVIWLVGYLDGVGCLVGWLFRWSWLVIWLFRWSWLVVWLVGYLDKLVLRLSLTASNVS